MRKGTEKELLDFLFITETQSIFFSKQRRKNSNCLSTVNLFPLKQNRRTFMKNNTKLKSRKINF